MTDLQINYFLLERVGLENRALLIPEHLTCSRACYLWSSVLLNPLPQISALISFLVWGNGLFPLLHLWLMKYGKISGNHVLVSTTIHANFTYKLYFGRTLVKCSKREASEIKMIESHLVMPEIEWLGVCPWTALVGISSIEQGVSSNGVEFPSCLSLLALSQTSTGKLGI